MKTLTVHSAEAHYGKPDGFLFGPGLWSLVVQVTSSPVSLGQEFSSQSPQVPQEAQGPKLQGVCELEWKIGNNPVQCSPMLVTLCLAQKSLAWGLPRLKNIRIPLGLRKHVWELYSLENFV